MIKVEFTIEQANALLYAAHFHRGLPWVADAAAILDEAILQAENSPDEDHPDDERRAHPPRPDWGLVTSGPLVRAAMGRMDTSPSFLANADEFGALLRDAFDEMGLSVRDEQTVYTVTALLHLMASVAVRQGEKDQLLAHYASFLCALVPYLPPEARQR